MSAIDRRELLKLGFAAAGVLLLPGVAQAQSSESGKQPMSDPELVVYYPQTGHNLAGNFLDYYRRHRHGELLGLPITEALPLPDGRLIQYFTNAALEEDPVNPPKLKPVNLGEQLVPKNHLSKTDLILNRLPSQFWQKHRGESFFGRPITAAILSNETKLSQASQGGPTLDPTFTQYLQNMAFIRHERIVPEPQFQGEGGSYDQFLVFKVTSGELNWPGEIEMLPLGKEAAERQGLRTERTKPHPHAEIYTPSMWDKDKQIVANLSSQTLHALEGKLPVMSTFISTGIPGYETVRGQFQVLSKTEVTDYVSPYEDVYYLVKAVPFNLRFYSEYYIHGAYWHQTFGDRAASRGCINVNLDDAKWLYDWAKVGTPVIVVDK